MFHEGVIKPAYYEWGSHIEFSSNNNATLQFCTTYRKLNFITIKYV